MKPELLIASLAGAVAIVSAAIAYVAQSDSSKLQAQVSLAQTATQQAHERQRPFIEAQMKYYIEVTEVVAKLPRTTNKMLRKQLTTRFWELYWGPLALVEDEEVASAMITYGEMLEGAPNDERLGSLSLIVAHACRESLKRLWVPQLGTITSIRPSAQ